MAGEPVEDNLRADLEAAFNDAPDAPAVDAPDPAKAEPAEVAEKTWASAEVADDRPRDATGKFIPKTEAAPAKAAPVAKTAAAPSAPAAAQKSPPTDVITKAGESQPSTAVDAPPVTWAAEAKAEWSALSPALKAAVLKREVEISAGGRQWSEQKRQLESAIEPVRIAASRRGMTAEQGIQSLVAANDLLDRDPVAGLQWLARSRGLDITVNGQQPNGSQPADGSSRIEPPRQAQADPRIDALWARIEADDRRQTDQTLQRVNTFATDPQHPHFDAVQDELMAMLPLLKNANPHATPEQLLQDAYDRAVYANPVTRAAVAAEQAAQADAARRARNAADVGKAKLAAVSIRGTPPAGNPAVPARDSIREELEAAFAAAR